jgi:RNA polymerase sigma factor (sigma-70 family)
VGLKPAAARGDHASAIADADVAWSLCQSLPKTQRAAVVLRYYDDQSYAQIADVLGCTESTARSHVRRALTALRTRLEEDSP